MPARAPPTPKFAWPNENCKVFVLSYKSNEVYPLDTAFWYLTNPLPGELAITDSAAPNVVVPILTYRESVVVPNVVSPDTDRFVEVILVPTSLLNEIFVEVILVPFANANEKLAVEVILGPERLVNERPDEKKLVEVTLVSVVLAETYKFVVVAFVPNKLVNERPVEKWLVEVTFEEETLVTKSNPVEVSNVNDGVVVTEPSSAPNAT